MPELSDPLEKSQPGVFRGSLDIGRMMSITIEQAQGLICEFCRIYPAALQLKYKVRATQEEAIHEPDLSEWWSNVDKRYPSLPESFKAEKLFCLACEAVEPTSTVDSLEAEQVFREVVLTRSRPMEHADLFTIAIAVADGFKNRTRFQRTFPVTDLDQWSS